MRHDLSEVLKDAEPGSWVALSSDETTIAGTGSSMREAVGDALMNGEHNPTLLLVPGGERSAPRLSEPDAEFLARMRRDVERKVMSSMEDRDRLVEIIEGLIQR